MGEWVSPLLGIMYLISLMTGCKILALVSISKKIRLFPGKGKNNNKRGTRRWLKGFSACLAHVWPSSSSGIARSSSHWTLNYQACMGIGILWG